MSKLGKRLIASAKEAVRYAKGEDVPGIMVHRYPLAAIMVRMDDPPDLEAENVRLRKAIKKVIRHFERSGIIGPLTAMLKKEIGQ